MQRPERIPTRLDRERDAAYLSSTGPWLVRCPRCDRCARVEGRRLVCGGCSLVRNASYDVTPDGLVHATTGARGRWQRDPVPAPRDEHYALWLREPCCGGEMLWAVNAAHLAYLERHVDAAVREGAHPPHQRPHHKPPAWMRSREHRAEVQTAIGRLRDRLATVDQAPAHR